MEPQTIAGLRFNDLGVEVTDAEIQATWAKHVTTERVERRRERLQEHDAEGLAERRWSQR